MIALLTSHKLRHLFRDNIILRYDKCPSSKAPVCEPSIGLLCNAGQHQRYSAAFGQRHKGIQETKVDMHFIGEIRAVQWPRGFTVGRHLTERQSHLTEIC